MNPFYKLINWLRKQTTQPARQNIDYEKLYLIAELEKLTIINKQLYQNMINNKIVLNVNYGGDMYTGDTEHTTNQAKQHDSTEYTDYEEEVRLGVQVHQQHLLALWGEDGTDGADRRRLSNAALVICKWYNLCHNCLSV